MPHRIIYGWYTGRWWVNCYIWYSEEGTGRGRSPPRPLLVVPNVTAHSSTVSVPITVLLYNGPLLYSFYRAMLCIARTMLSQDVRQSVRRPCSVETVSTLRPKKVSPLMFDNNFGNRGPIFKILLPIDSEENSLCTYHKDFHITFNMLLHSVV